MFEIITALVTPFDENNNINLLGLNVLIEKQIREKVDGIVIGGTTGESSTLTADEQIKLYREAVRLANGRIKIYLGIGSNCTTKAVELAKFFNDLDIAGYLVVVPYYNRPTDEGIFKHFVSIAQATNKNIIIYNVPRRTGISISVQTIKKLENIPNIVGIKEASHNFILMDQIINETKLKLYVGNDELILYASKQGFAGVVSVASNIIALKVRDMINQKDAFIQEQITSLTEQPNPMLIKSIMKYLKYPVGNLRLPLTNLEDKVVEQYINIIEDNKNIENKEEI